VTICLPTYNERDNVEQMLHALAPLGVHVLVIDDNSPDGTGEIADRVAAELENVSVLHRERKEGLGPAYIAGFRRALAEGADYVITMDCDFSHDPADVPRLVAACDAGADIALGSRYLDGAPPPSSALRRLGTALFRTVATLGTGQRITDPTSGFQGLSARALAAVTHDGFPEEFPDTDVLIGLVRQGLSLREVPVRMRVRRGGVSMHRGARIAYYGYHMTLQLALLRVRRKTPFRAADTVARRTA
jgi:dolichol-phosphate mannosyltransferase